MKRFISILLLVILSISFSGCTNLNQHKMIKTKAPTNESLSIKGKWIINDYRVLNGTSNFGKELKGQEIEISDDYIRILGDSYSNISYKLKIVKNDYVISYETNYSVKDLDINQDTTEVFSAIDKNNILFEFFKGSNDKSFIFYRGILFNVKFIGDINEKEINEEEKSYDIADDKKEDEVVNKKNNDYDDPVAVYFGIKSKKETGENEKEETYKTIFISFKDGVLNESEKEDEIIIPRLSGIWSIKKYIGKTNGHRHEYFSAQPIDGKEEESEKSLKPTDVNNNIYRSIKYIGNDYVATEVYEGENFVGDYNKYEVIPVDNLISELPVNIGDIFSTEGTNLFKQEYDKAIASIPKEEIKDYSPYINYSNFSMERSNGKWNMIAKISPSYNGEGSGYDYLLNLRPNKKLINYDLLSIPWKTLNRSVPLLKDAFISPNNRIAIVVTNGKLLVYEIENGEITDNLLGSISLDNDDEIVMAEWCTGDYYVSKWEKPFLD